MLPASIKENINNELGFTSYKSLGGSSLNNVGMIESKKGRFFAKWNQANQLPVFEAEVNGLELLRGASAGFLVPEMITIGSNETYAWVVFEYIEETRWKTGAVEKFGQNLAKLHQNTATHFGLSSDNFIGKLYQSNSQKADWCEFFAQNRLHNLLKQSVEKGLISSSYIKNAERLQAKLPDIFPDEPPSLIHGDLWSGNFMQAGTETVLIDPAVYYANREIEIAFTQLFGGFPSSFYQSYNEAMPLAPGFESRSDVYNLYPLLVHTLLFGSSYATSVMNILRRF